MGIYYWHPTLKPVHWALVYSNTHFIITTMSCLFLDMLPQISGSQVTVVSSAPVASIAPVIPPLPVFHGIPQLSDPLADAVALGSIIATPTVPNVSASQVVPARASNFPMSTESMHFYMQKVHIQGKIFG